MLAGLFLTSRAQIETDRPDFTESPNVVPKGSIQFETGVIFEQDLLSSTCRVIQRNITLSTGLLRYGIGKRTELRFNYSLDQSTTLIKDGPCPMIDLILPEDEFGFSPFFLGVKQNIMSTDRVSIGVLAHAYFPTEKNFTPEVLVPVGLSITDKFGVAFQLGGVWNDEVDARYGYTLALGYAVTSKLGVYIEPYGYFHNSDNANLNSLLINGGFTYAPTDNMMFDLTTGKGISDNAADFFVGCGFSYLYQK